MPPRISRTDVGGNEIGESYQADCIASWIDAGFSPVTVNASCEHVGPEPRIRQVRLERDASEITGKPHPYLSDLLSKIAEETEGPFALVNADILIPSHAGLAKKVTSLRRGEVIIGRRLNVARLGGLGAPYFSGFDFFAAHGDDVAVLAATQLVFGAPWWDHFFPLAMHLHGCKVTQLEPQVIHLHHDERWNLATYLRLGDRFIAEIRPKVRATEYECRLGRILANARHGRRAAARDLTLRWLRPLGAEERHRLVLDRVGNLNLAVIDQFAPPPASSSVGTPLRLRVQAKLTGAAVTLWGPSVRDGSRHAE